MGLSIGIQCEGIYMWWDVPHIHGFHDDPAICLETLFHSAKKLKEKLLY